MNGFNLVDQPWIPCLMLDGSHQELGLQETLTRAHEIAEVVDQSPLITAALHRLLLAILHRNFGPADQQAWKVIWEAGWWDGKVLAGYFATHRPRFGLFDPERPFYQVPKMDDVEVHPIQRLAQESASGNNPTLFDHSFAGRPEPLPAGRAACYLVAAQAFAIGGGVSKPFNLSDAPLARGYSVMSLGNSLFETLALNLMQYRITEQDKPCWEQEQPAVPAKEGTKDNGLLDYLTWQSRRIYLQADDDGVHVRFCQIQQNLKHSHPGSFDPFKPYRRDKEGGWIPLRLDPERAVWRDAHALLQMTDSESGDRPPEVFHWLAKLSRDRSIRIAPIQRFAVLGLGTEPGKATAVLWRHERLPLPLAYLSDSQLQSDLETGLERAAQVGWVLRDAAEGFARRALRPQGNDSPPEASKLSRHLVALDDYWASLGDPFRRLMIALPVDGDGALREWARQLRRIATQRFRQAIASVDNSAWNLKAAGMAERRFYGRLKGVLKNLEEVDKDESERHDPELADLELQEPAH